MQKNTQYWASITYFVFKADDLKYLMKLVTLLYSIHGSACFLLLMLLFFPLFIIASFFGRVRGGNIIYNICRLWADIWMFLIGIFHKNIYLVPHDTSRQYIFVSNHISYMD